MKITSCVRRNVRKHREINIGDQYIIFNISSKLYFVENRGVASSESRYYMGRPGKGLTTSMDLSTKTSNKKQKSKFYMNDMTN